MSKKKKGGNKKKAAAGGDDEILYVEEFRNLFLRTIKKQELNKKTFKQVIELFDDDVGSPFTDHSLAHRSFNLDSPISRIPDLSDRCRPTWTQR